MRFCRDSISFTILFKENNIESKVVMSFSLIHICAVFFSRLGEDSIFISTKRYFNLLS